MDARGHLKPLWTIVSIEASFERQLRRPPGTLPSSRHDGFDGCQQRVPPALHRAITLLEACTMRFQRIPGYRVIA
jgi:hypothetical protein